jgi:uncharacterized protein (TIGR03067 family)
MLTSILCTTILLLAPGTPDDKREVERLAELEKLQGEWVMHASESKGLPARTPPPSIWTFNGTEYSTMQPGGGGVTVKIAIDPSQSPKHLDRTAVSGRVMLGIYKLEGDTLTICGGTADKRPTEFKTTADFGTITVLKRKPKE